MELAGPGVEHLEALKTVRSLADHHVVDVHVDCVQAHAFALRHQIRPRLSPRTVNWRRDELEVVRAVIRQDQEAVFLVVNGILDAVATGLEEDRLAGRIVAAQVAALARDLARAREDDVTLALRQLDAELEALIVLLEDEHITADGRAQLVPPDLVRAHRLVGADIEECLAVGRPGRAVIEVVEDVWEVPPGRQVAEAHLVELVAGEVDGVGEDVLVRAVLDVPELEIVVARGQLVPVELDLLGGIHRALPPAVDVVVEPLHRSGVVPVALEVGRRRSVGLLDPVDDLLVQPLLEPGCGRHDGVSEQIFGFQVGNDFRVGSLP